MKEDRLSQTNEKNHLHTKSEEVQAIIDRMPTYWVRWVELCVGLLIGIIALLGFLIQYPDTVDGQISVTATTAPVRSVANSNGRINLLQSNKSQLKNGDVYAYLVLISFPDGTVTNFGKILPLDFESKGTVEIITKRKRLIEWLFDNLKAKVEK